MKTLLLDSHCHLDQFPNPLHLASQASSHDLFVIAVTNLPSHFEAGLLHVRNLPLVRLAIGLHPLICADLDYERNLFRKLLPLTTFVGEVGLDFSYSGKKTFALQLETFRFIAAILQSTKKVLSVHSRGAEAQVLDILNEFNIQKAIFHWYTGPLNVLDEIISQGHYLSVNTGMINSVKGQKIIARIPKDRLLTETDGPYIKIGRSSAYPWNVLQVEKYFSEIWNLQPNKVRQQVWDNFQGLLKYVSNS